MDRSPSEYDYTQPLPRNVFRLFQAGEREPAARMRMREVIRTLLDWYYEIEDGSLTLPYQSAQELLEGWLHA